MGAFRSSVRVEVGLLVRGRDAPGPWLYSIASVQDVATLQGFPMTTDEIHEYIDAAVRSAFSDYTSESGEMMTSEDGDGRFLGKVSATRYSGLPAGGDIFVAIGKTREGAQIVKVGKSECVKPETGDLDLLLEKELGIKRDGE